MKIRKIKGKCLSRMPIPLSRTWKTVEVLAALGSEGFC